MITSKWQALTRFVFPHPLDFEILMIRSKKRRVCEYVILFGE